MFNPKRKYSPIEILYIKRYSKLYREDHKAEYYSTSPYAPTDKTARMRIVDNAITKGHGHTDEVSSTNHYGFFGGFKGSSLSGGGGDWEIDTEVQFDRIYLCPVTGKEFLEKDLSEHKSSQLAKLKDWVEEQMRNTRFATDFGLDGWKVTDSKGITTTHYREQVERGLDE